MKFIPRLALAAALSVAMAGAAEALPLSPLAPAPSLVQHTAVTVTKTVRRGRMGRRVVTKRVVHRGPFGGRRVTVTKTVR